MIRYRENSLIWRREKPWPDGRDSFWAGTAYRWFCHLDLDDKVPDHSTFSVNRHGRFRDSDIFRSCV